MAGYSRPWQRLRHHGRQSVQQCRLCEGELGAAANLRPALAQAALRDLACSPQVLPQTMERVTQALPEPPPEGLAPAAK